MTLRHGRAHAYRRTRVAGKRFIGLHDTTNGALVISAKWLHNMSKKTRRDPPLLPNRVDVDVTRDILSSSATSYSSLFRSRAVEKHIEGTRGGVLRYFLASC
jgi:hypothetical protein